MFYEINATERLRLLFGQPIQRPHSAIALALLAPFFEKAKEGGILVVGEIKRAMDVRLGRKVTLASAYNLLHRHGWRKLVPDKQHPQANVAAQEHWKKTPRRPRGNRPAVAQ